MKICGIEIHPAATLLPPLPPEKQKALTESMKTVGQLQKVKLLDGKCIDGRHRLAVCAELRITPKTEEIKLAAGMTPTRWILESMNHRDLTKGQRSMIAQDALPRLEAEARERQKAGLKKGTKSVSAPVRSREAQESEVRGKAAAQAAAAVGVSTKYVETAKAVASKDPELAKKVRAGEVTLKQAEKQIRKTEQVKAARAYTPPTGSYQVVACDPPWPFRDQLDGSDDARGGLDYPAMTLDAICAMSIPADSDAILWLWVTNAHLIDGSAAKVLDAWGFTGKTLLTWDKRRTPTDLGAGRWLRNVTEHCILATRGRAVVTLTNQQTLIAEGRREHSRKPAAFYKLVEDLCPSTSRVELFARESREGWFTSGIEGRKFDPPPPAPKVDGRGLAAGPPPSGDELSWLPGELPAATGRYESGPSHDGPLMTPETRARLEDLAASARKNAGLTYEPDHTQVEADIGAELKTRGFNSRQGKGSFHYDCGGCEFSVAIPSKGGTVQVPSGILKQLREHTCEPRTETKQISGRCISCGCTDEKSCPPNPEKEEEHECVWVNLDSTLCTHCAEPEPADKPVAKRKTRPPDAAPAVFFGDCYVCNEPIRTMEKGITVDAIGKAHNPCLNNLASAQQKERFRKLGAAKPKDRAEPKKSKAKPKKKPAA